MSVNPEAVGDVPEDADEYLKDAVNTDRRPNGSDQPDGAQGRTDAHGAGDGPDVRAPGTA